MTVGAPNFGVQRDFCFQVFFYKVHGFADGDEGIAFAAAGATGAGNTV